MNAVVFHTGRELKIPTPSKRSITRRKMLEWTGKVVVAGALTPLGAFGKSENSAHAFGAVVGDVEAAKIGEKILRDGGNAIDAAVASAFSAGITSPSKCGLGGYGGHAIIALTNGKITAIDFNSAAPQAARADMFPLNGNGKVKNNLNMVGWLAAAVPGTAAGLGLALERHGTLSLREILSPTIDLCEKGMRVPKVSALDDASRNDPRPDSAQPQRFFPANAAQNASLLKLLKTLAERNSVDSFYRGDIAQTIADAFQKNGGIVTARDMAAYRAREVDPLKLDWNGMTIHTTPLTSPGLMMLEAFSILKTLDWQELAALPRLHAKIEALRIAWRDRNEFFGDPEKVSVPIKQLLSSQHAEKMASAIRRAVKEGTAISQTIEPNPDEGTINITAADAHGNMIALTLTHGSSFGARVSVEELGMVLGHGMWRFDPRPGRPNSPGPGKRPINNMCPTIVTRGGKAIFAVGGAGGTRIPNSIYEVLINYVGLGATMQKAMQAPRIETDGTLKLGVEKTHSSTEQSFLKQIGYKTGLTYSAYVSAATFDPKNGKCQAMSTGGI